MSTVEELKKKADTLEVAWRNTQATAQVLMKELATGTVPCMELRRYNNLATSIFASQFKLWSKLALQGAITGNMPSFPSLPVLFWEFSPGRGFNFDCRAGVDKVGPGQFKAIRFDTPGELFSSFFGVSLPLTTVDKAVAIKDEGLGVAPIILIIAGITIAVSATTIAVVAVEASKDKALSQDTLNGMKAESELRRFLAEARLEFVSNCQGKGGNLQQCGDLAVQAAEQLPKDFNKLGKDKFGTSDKLAWLFGGALAVLGVGGGLFVYNRRKKGVSA
jgi:hypothetical protein